MSQGVLNMPSRKQKLQIIGAVAVLALLALAMSCRGFFPANTLQSIAIAPSSLDMELNTTQQFTAWGTYEDNTRSEIKSGVIWTSSDPSVTITSGGVASAETVTSSAVTITGEAQGLSGTASVNVLGDVTSITVSSQSVSVVIGDTVDIDFLGNPGPPSYITTGNGGTLGFTTGDSDFNCAVGTDNEGHPTEACTPTTGAAATYGLYMTYPTPSGGTVSSPTVTVTVSGS
jgi:hypothetical protein